MIRNPAAGGDPNCLLQTAREDNGLVRFLKRFLMLLISCMKLSISSFRTLKFIIHRIFRGVGGSLCSLPLAGRQIYCSADIVSTEAAASRLQINTHAHRPGSRSEELTLTSWINSWRLPSKKAITCVNTDIHCKAPDG